MVSPQQWKMSLEALLKLVNSSDGFRIDASKMILRGFSAGANIIFMVPLELHTHLRFLTTRTVNPNTPKPRILTTTVVSPKGKVMVSTHLCRKRAKSTKIH